MRSPTTSKDLLRGKTKTSKVLSFVTDFVFIAFIVLLGWFLIGYYLQYNYLSTGYQDWIYHAFRIKSIEEWGIVSWDHKWANGINYWQGYQYIPHLLTLYTAKILNIGITNAMLLWTVAVFIYLRVASYLVVRSQKINKVVAFFVTIVSYASIQNWHVIGDYSFYISSIVLPVFIWLYFKASTNNTLYMFLAVLSGFFMNLHPLLGIICSSLLLLTFVINKTKIITLLLYFVLMIITAAPYFIPYVSSTYNFINPYFLTYQFMQHTVNQISYVGLGLPGIILVVGSIIGFLINGYKVDKSTKILFVYILTFIIYLTLFKYQLIPDFINRFQISRGNFYIGILVPIVFARIVDETYSKIQQSKFVISLVASLIGIITVTSIYYANSFTDFTVNVIPNPVQSYFGENIIANGSIFYFNDSEASYFSSNKIRQVGSYSDHLLPSPLSLRYKNILSGGKSHLIVSEKQIDLINDYSSVLGVEYLFLPIKSPITKSLLASETGFIYEDDIVSDTFSYSVFRNEKNVKNAYLIEKSDFYSVVSLTELPKPVLSASSYNPWDKEVSALATLLRSNKVYPVTMTFVKTDTLSIDTTYASQMQEPILFITQSYDNNWNIVEAKEIDIVPTNLRFMAIDLSNHNSIGSLTLINSWPNWHWPVQYIGFGSVIAVGLTVGVHDIFSRKKQ